jgi:tRNA pseudouridine38-40 synthase
LLPTWAGEKAQTSGAVRTEEVSAGRPPSEAERVGTMNKLLRNQQKDPFLSDRAFYYPYPLDIALLNAAATAIQSYKDFTSFYKKNTQVAHFECSILKSEWVFENNFLVYNVEANRFLRGMVKGLVGTMLKVGTGKLSVAEFCSIVEGKDCSKADFSVPPHGLCLITVSY